MKAWLWMLGGLLIWGAHFAGLYALASLADVVSRAEDPVFRLVGAGFSLACLVALAVLGTAAARRVRREPSWSRQIAAGSALFGGVSVVWQSLPLIVGH